jgi:cellulose biosynthesis protein BcsQ
MCKKIINISGSKGGVGKSIISMCVLDYLENEDSPILVESDTSNPDVWKAYKNRVQSELINLDDKDGWIKFINFYDSNKNSNIVINSAARSND